VCRFLVITVIRDTDSQDSSSSIEPACEIVLRSDRAEWRDPEELTGGLAAFKEACGLCFPDGEPEIGTTILRSTCHHGDRYHRPADADADPEADGGTELVADGGEEQRGELRDLTPADGVERHLSEILEKSGSLPARYHAREALQHLTILEERDGS
jgi:hypothetical protein